MLQLQWEVSDSVAQPNVNDSAEMGHHNLSMPVTTLAAINFSALRMSPSIQRTGVSFQLGQGDNRRAE